MIQPIHIAAWLIFLSIGMVLSLIMDHISSQKEENFSVSIKPKNIIIEQSALMEYTEEDDTKIDASTGYLDDSTFDMFDKKI